MTETPAEGHADRTAFLTGGGEMGALLRSMDWSRSSIGAPASWPETLKQAAGLILAAPFPAGIIWGPERIHLYNNAYRAACAPDADASLGRDYKDSIPTIWPVVRDPLERCLLDAQPATLSDIPLAAPRGPGLPDACFTLHFSPIRDPAGRVQGVLHSVVENPPPVPCSAHADHTAAMLHRANQELDALTTALSHDLRAPVRHIDAFVKMFEEREGAGLSDEGRRFLQRFRLSAERMGALIDGMLRLCRVGRSGVRRSTIDSEALVRSVWNQLGPHPRGAVLELKPIPPVNADAELLRLLWRTLIENAVKFSAGSEHPRVTVDARREGDRTWYRITDNGVGFDHRYAYKLFNIFQRLHSTDEFPGDGVGLAVAKKIIDLHAGSIKASSPPGRQDDEADHPAGGDVGGTAEDAAESSAARESGGALFQFTLDPRGT